MIHLSMDVILYYPIIMEYLNKKREPNSSLHQLCQIVATFDRESASKWLRVLANRQVFQRKVKSKHESIVMTKKMQDCGVTAENTLWKPV